MSKENRNGKQESKPISKSKKIYNIVSTLVIAVIFVFLVVVVALMLWQRNKGEDVSVFGYYTFNVITDSMQDTINPGDVIIGKSVDANTLVKEDIITFVAPSGALKGHNITHRIKHVERDEDGNVLYFKTKGDNPTAQMDAWELQPSAVKAKYVKTSGFMTGIRKLLSKWYGYVLLIVLPMTLVIILFVAGYVKDRVALEREKEAEKGNATTASLDGLSDEEKQKLLEDYLDGGLNKADNATAYKDNCDASEECVKNNGDADAETDVTENQTETNRNAESAVDDKNNG